MKYNCTACDVIVRRAEYAHDLLNVPLCGQCYNRYHHADFSYKDQYCVWCGEGDDSRELFCCDSCSYAFCANCLNRNFGHNEVAYVREKEPWSCYICLPTAKIKALKVRDGHSFYNINRAYNAIHPPTVFESTCCDTSNFSEGELKYISIVTSSIYSQQFHYSSVASEYLHARDIFSIIYRLSKNIRLYFTHHFLYPSPGLFKTGFGEDNGCKLYNHQLISLQKMVAMENSSQCFGSLRGGLLADEPGLGKTVTVIALCLSTAGMMTKSPDCFWDYDSLTTSWKAHALSGSLLQVLLRVINNMMKIIGESPSLVIIRQKITAKPMLISSVIDFERLVYDALRHDKVISPLQRSITIRTFKQDMIRVKSQLDKKSRHHEKSYEGRRLLFERSLRPSCGTLIIVPLVLLEHWFEQLQRHVGLHFLSDADLDTTYMNDSDGLPRGVVFVDGLGDIVDVEAPLPKLAVAEGFNLSMENISSYMFVITTFERCAALQATRMNYMRDNDIIYDGATSGTTTTVEDIQAWGSTDSSAALKAFFGVRWLRLVVDEGHELGSSTSSSPSPSASRKRDRSHNESITAAAADFIGDIAAERRWVMSGTPTTGTTTRDSFYQLQKLLKFLRHAKYGTGTGICTWEVDVVAAIIDKQSASAWEGLLTLLRSIMIRHTKNDLKLDEPIHSLVNLHQLPDPNNPNEEKSRHIDRAMAKYIADTLSQYRDDWRRSHHSMRRPKAIVFSQYKHDLQGVGHFLYTDIRFGDRSICEHDGTYRSSELSRFRHSKKKFRCCMLCGHENLITTGQYCDNTLMLVEYLFDGDNAVPGPVIPFAPPTSTSTAPASPMVVPPSEAGHSAYGRGGHFTGPCLCSSQGCMNPAQCHGFINALGPARLDNALVHNPNLAIVAQDQIVGHMIGRRWLVGEEVNISHQQPYPSGVTAPILWKNGRLGGRARIIMWLKCGSRSRHTGWHGGHVLERSRWQSTEEDASILLLHTDGSHGLDLSFATHLFLLDKIKDPALEGQIISRAHRMGATGPVQVQLLQTYSTKNEEIPASAPVANGPYW